MKWINVNNSLPHIDDEGDEGDQESAYVLCYNKDQFPYEPFVGWYSHRDGTWTVAHYTSSEDPQEVTHWMELPKSPNDD